MNFAPKTEAEVQAAGLLPAGEYDFEVAEATDEVSKKDNEMIKLKLHVYKEDGNYATIFDYLLESMASKLRHFAFGTGLGAAYEAGRLGSNDAHGRTGRCKIIVQPAKDGYDAKNAVRDYIVPKDTGNGATKPLTSDPRPPVPAFDDEVPF